MDRIRSEQWKAIAGYEGLYEISDCGRVKSLRRMVSNGTGMRLVKERILKPRSNRKYLYVNLYRDNNVMKSFDIHQLVIQHFGLPKPSILHEVNHKDGVKSNNHYTNLEWVTSSQNKQHAYSIGLPMGRKQQG